MKIHNIMEDLVHEAVTDIFDEEAGKEKRAFCTCFQCKLDVSCYILNRLEPKYVLSSRGLSRINTDVTQDQQTRVDIVALTKEAIEKVSGAKRPNFRHNDENSVPLPEGPVFNYPVIVGKVLNGNSFEPLRNAEVSLLRNGKPVSMIDPGWENPHHVTDMQPGQFIFWPYPDKAEALGETKSVSMEIQINVPGFEEKTHFLEVPLLSEEEVQDSCHITETFKVDDILLFSEGA